MPPSSAGCGAGMTPFASVLLPLLACIIACNLDLAVAFSCRYHCDFVGGYGGQPTRRTTRSPLLLAIGSDASTGEGRAPQSKEKWILIVEDESSLRAAIGKFLAKEGGYYVTGVADARSAILLCRGIVRPGTNRSRLKFDPEFSKNATHACGGPDCLVLDIRLGSMDGIELLKFIRSDPTTESLPVVLLTAKGKVDDRVTGYRAGADAYLAKPFDPNELLSIVNGLLLRDGNPTNGGGKAGDAKNDMQNPVYGDLKRELTQIKDLLREIDDRPSTSESGQLSLSSLNRDVSEMRDIIASQVANNAPSRQESEGVSDQYDTLSVLSPEETQIMSLIAQGLSNRDIANALECSVSKIEKNISQMFRKAGVDKRTALIAWWREAQLD